MSDDDFLALSSSDDDDDDVFGYKKIEFHKNSTVDKETPSPQKKRRTTKGSSTDDALSRLEERRQHSKCIDISAVDDDSDNEKVSATVKHTANGSTAIEIDSSDDEAPSRPLTISTQTPVYAMAQSGISKEVCSKIQQARHASYQLQLAQRYRAEDVWIPEAVPQPPVVMLASPPAPAPATQNLGPTLRLSLRTTHVVNGKRSDSTTTDNMTIRRLEPFQRLIERYQNHHSISPSESRVLISFDGKQMDPTRNPGFYDLEDEDLVDVVVETLAIHAPVNLGQYIQLNMRTRQANGSITNDILSIREQETLQKLLEKYKTQKKLSAAASVHLSFDGAALNLTKTPKFYDMESDDIIEVRL